jgi:hypothetical protein
MFGMTVDEAIRALTLAREQLGGDAPLMMVDENGVRLFADAEHGCVFATDFPAKHRQKAGRQAGGKASGKLPQASAGRTRDKVAEAVGMSGRTYEKARAVVEAAEADPAAAPLVEEMDRTGKVNPAFQAARTFSRAPREPDPDNNPEDRKVRGKGVAFADEAINFLTLIPEDDAYRQQGLKIVADWIRKNR